MASSKPPSMCGSEWETFPSARASSYEFEYTDRSSPKSLFHVNVRQEYSVTKC